MLVSSLLVNIGLMKQLMLSIASKADALPREVKLPRQVQSMHISTEMLRLYGSNTASDTRV